MFEEIEKSAKCLNDLKLYVTMYCTAARPQEFYETVMAKLNDVISTLENFIPQSPFSTVAPQKKKKP